ncbi:hypothetical protein ACF09J_34530 [Streptomyces sp. NPDC014889]|uniref:hypothetical protein n=1 Tax=Streptomyces sp. NPDC014889 TaxID=3364928 RepID=UPI0036FFEB5A
MLAACQGRGCALRWAGEGHADVDEPVETFCSIATPLAVSEASRLTSTELGGILNQLVAKESGTVATDLRVLAAYHNGDNSLASQADTVRPKVARWHRGSWQTSTRCSP